ncbi:MAG: zinc-binding dehydrogenase [Anaerolineales bacterium]|nr:zinc-binding dehydrogenase [Anaerolineales bacterium]
MKSVLLDEHGGPEVLRYDDFPEPEPGRREVQVRLRAAALNRLDLWVREGWPGLKLEYPHIPGADGAGEISALGEGVTDLEVGTRVVINSNLSCGRCSFCLAGKDNMCRHWHLLGETIRGTYAEYVVVPDVNVLPLPEGFTFDAAAAAGLVYHTAWHSLIVRGNLRPGESILIVGASGGVNTASIQIAKLSGAKVYVVGSSTEKLALAESLGADVVIDRNKEEDWSKAVFQATKRQGVDIVVDNVGAGTMPLSLRAARKGGRILTVGNTAGPKFEIDNRFIFGKHLSILGSTMGTRDDFATVMNLIFEGSLNPVLDRQYPLEEAAAAQERLAAGEQMGKITLVI